MILRRLSQSLKEQNWTAIWIEFILLVAGVFLGMQVSNWNSERETNQKARDFTARLKDDLLKEAWGYESIIEYNRETNKNQRQVLDATVGDIDLSDEQFVISAYRATQYIYNVRYRAAYDELVSTGTINLIADQEMRETASAIFTTPLLDQITQKGMGSEYRALFRETVSAEVQEALLTSCGDRYATVLDYDSIKGAIDYPCTLGLTEGKVQTAANALKALPRFVPALQMRFADTQSALTDLQKANDVVLKSLRNMRDASK